MCSSSDTLKPGPYYSDSYTTVFRWISFYHQIELVRRFQGENILEVGIGDKTSSNYLRRHGINITTCDFDASLEPDVLGDVRQLPFEDNSFHCVSAFEILEHIPWSDVDCALSELSRVSSENVVVSVPYYSPALNMVVKLPKVRRLVNLLVRIPIPFIRTHCPPDGSHCWEIGRKHFPLKRIRGAIRKWFEIIDESSPPLVPGHYFFTLKKRRSP